MYIDRVLNIRRNYSPISGTYISENRPVIYRDGVIPPWEPKTVWDTVVGDVERMAENSTSRHWEAQQQIEKTGRETNRIENSSPARFPKHYRALHWGNKQRDNMGIVWRSGLKIHHHSYFNLDAEYYPNRHLDLPATEDTVFQWIQTQKPATINLFDGERQYRWHHPNYDNKAKPPEVRVMRVRSDYLMGGYSKPIDEQWPLDIRNPSRYTIIEDAPEELAAYVGLRSERGDIRREFYLDPQHDYICLRQIWWKQRSGQWEKQRDFGDSAFERLPQGQWYASKHGDNWNLHVVVLQENEFPPDTFNGEKLLDGVVIETY